ncbi:MAG: class I SAM-dependent methyltransferase [Gemmatimonadota bacterium]|nr:class I SAM-dependent methyltransferase [Gemmatimonadota bacterium]
MDQIAALNEKHWTRAVQEGAGCTAPWLDLDPAVVRAYAGGTLENPAGPLYQIYPAHVLVKAQNNDVLCLASGGGQQSAVFGLLGARVTVLDLTQAQLNGDRAAAAHYGYNLTTIRGDMRDLSCLADTAFPVDQQYGLLGQPQVDPAEVTGWGSVGWEDGRMEEWGEYRQDGRVERGKLYSIYCRTG